MTIQWTDKAPTKPEVPGKGQLDSTWVSVFNQLARRFCKTADMQYTYFSDLVYDAHNVCEALDGLAEGESTERVLYCRSMGTYIRALHQGVDWSVPCDAAYLIEISRMRYGSPYIEVLEYAGPFNSRG